MAGDSVLLGGTAQAGRCFLKLSRVCYAEEELDDAAGEPDPARGGLNDPIKKRCRPQGLQPFDGITCFKGPSVVWGHFCFVADTCAHQLVDGGALLPVAAVAPPRLAPRCGKSYFSVKPFQLIRRAFSDSAASTAATALAERIGLRGGGSVFCAISSTGARCGRQKPL